jgi:hypothetical protein
MNDLLKDLSPDTLKQIEEAIEAKVKEKTQIHVEKALVEQDAVYSSKLEQLIEAIDKDHVKKLERVVEALDADRAKKLAKVVKKYETVLNEDANKFKAQLVESISEYLDVYLKEVVPAADIQEAVRNKKAVKVLESLRAHLAVDAALQKDTIKEAVLDGKKQIDEASKKLESVIAENTALKSELDSIKANLLIEQKTANLEDSQKKYIKKVLNGKSADFIAENFDYTLKLFNKKNNDRLESLKEEALNESTKADRIVEQTEEVVNENTQQLSPYIAELSKY